MDIDFYKDYEQRTKELRDQLDKHGDIAVRRYFRGEGYPHFLYKYTAPDLEDKPERVRQVIVENKLFSSKIDDFNDPFDCRAYTTIDSSAREKRKTVERLVRKFQPELNWKNRKAAVTRYLRNVDYDVESIYRIAYEKNRNATGVISLTKNPRNIQMWSYYADNHRGLAYQFRICGKSPVFMMAQNVMYQEGYQELPILNLLKYSERELLEKTFLFKAKGWEHEKESRIILPGAVRKHVNFQPEHLTGVILGCRAPSALENFVRDLIAESSSSVTLYRAIEHPREYRLRLYKAESYSAE